MPGRKTIRNRIPAKEVPERMEIRKYIKNKLIRLPGAKRSKITYSRVLKGDESKLAEKLVKKEGRDPKWDPYFSNLVKSAGVAKEKPFKGGTNLGRTTPEKIHKIRMHRKELNILKKTKK